MAAQHDGGSILNFGRVTSHLPLSRVFAYSAAKAAVVNLTKNLAREYAAKKVRINVLCPGFFPAEQNRKILDQERVANIMQQTPVKRFGDPHELVGATLESVSATLLLVWLPAGSFIASECRCVAGGLALVFFLALMD